MYPHDAYGSRVLLFGHEDSLLLTRKLLLATLGCPCVHVRTVIDFRQQTLSEGFSLVILCQTLTPDEVASASAFAAEHLPDVPLLMMFSQHFRYESNRDFVLLDATAGPEAFVQTTKRMLAQATLRAAGSA